MSGTSPSLEAADPSAAPAPRWAWLLAPTPRWFWAIIAVASTAAWFLVGEVDAPFGFDWSIYGEAFRRWRETGTPYQILPPRWDPCRDFPYIYPPSSWPLLPMAAYLPYQFLALGTVPVIWTPPRLGLIPLAAVFLFIGLGAALWLGNVNVLILGLLSLAFRPGRVGGIALALAVAIKGYPLVLLPLLWSDRTRLRWFLALAAGLAATGTMIFGPRAWVNVTVTLMREGPHCDVSLNPFAGLGWWRVAPAALLSLAGWRLRSPTLSLLGATFVTGVVTRHYLPTLAATLPHEPLGHGRRQDREDREDREKRPQGPESHITGG